ncbi:MAG: tol-pal system protein YbgF [Roseitalea sp.]|nr:tol-pal system protein YbgF [Roseitalea sp.]MBO6723629.1 tol-pal system protein YbgF [Roseitalea sp.]MBO6741871.1 tol-pal system protein YbgF [Roseitalea sp.]
MTRPKHSLWSLPALCLLGLAAWTAPAATQITDPRVLQLEEQVRQLTGRLEELNFQLLQMQEQLRRQQEDNEFRLQQLEDRQQGALDPQTGGSAVASTGTDKAPRIASGTTEGTPARDLGTLTIGQDGAVSGAGIDFSETGVGAAIGGDQTNAIPEAAGAEALYRTGYDHVLNGDYALAEQVFGRFVELYPDDALVADARFWLGESVLGQGRFEDAAEIFIDTRARHPQAGKAAETMLKIGTIMAALGDRDIACVTFADALRAHPSMADNLRQRIQAEHAKARC